MSRSGLPLAAVAWCLAMSHGRARADAPPDPVAPFLSAHDDMHYTATGAFGPAQDTIVVVTFDLRGAGTFRGFALVPDATSAHGYRKLALPKLPKGSMGGEMRTALVANLDQDPADELVLEFHVDRYAPSPAGGYTYGTREYVVLDWNGKAFVRLYPLEQKLARAMKKRELWTEPLTEEQIRSALGLPAKKTSHHS